MRYTEYHDGVAVIKDKALLKGAMAKYEDADCSQVEPVIIAVSADRD